jgi:hypothetical protein
LTSNALGAAETFSTKTLTFSRFASSICLLNVRQSGRRAKFSKELKQEVAELHNTLG